LSLLVICPLRNMEPLKEASPQPRVSWSTRTAIRQGCRL
jgi:hypothetical protein